MAGIRHECSICMDSFKNPKLISCHHSFCFKCLDDYVRVNLRNGRFDCPICRTNVELPKGGVRDFQSNFYIDDSDEKLYCDLCGPKSVACSRCLDCEENFCQSCCFAHEKSKLSKHHKISDLGTLDSAVKGKIRQRIFCDRHPEEEIKLFCRVCKVLICFLCKAVNHENHATKTVADAAAEVKKTLQTKMKECSDKLRCINASKQEVEGFDKCIDDAEQEELKAADDQRSWLNKVLDQELLKVEDKIKNVYHDLRQQNAVFKRNLEHDFKTCSDANDNAQTLTAKGTDVEIITNGLPLGQLISAAISKTFQTPNTCLKKKMFMPAEIKPHELISLIGKMHDSTELSLEQVLLPADENKEEKLMSVPQYFASKSREVRVCHEMGILCYDNDRSSVGQFIAPKPLTKTNSKCSITIVAPGSKTEIGIGLVPVNYRPKRLPGWDLHAVGYHSDDGGIYLEKGYSNVRRETCDVGDVMEVEVDIDRNMLWFKKNGRKMIELSINFINFGLYPCVGFRSKGEAVKLNEKEVWTAVDKTDITKMPPAFQTYKYDSLWISPGKRIRLTKLRNSYSGWLILHNPMYNPVRYRVTVGKNIHVKIGQLKQQEQFVDFIDVNNTNIEEIHEATVEWIVLDLGREYRAMDLKKFLGVMDGKFRHMLNVELFDPSNDLTEFLPRKKMFWCKDSCCPKRFSTTTQRERHWRDAHGPVRNCEVCGKSFPTNRTYMLKQHLQKCHPDGGRSSVIVPPCPKEATKSWKDTETVRRLPYPFPNTKSTLVESATIQPQGRPCIQQSTCDTTTEPAVPQHIESDLPETALVPFFLPEETAAPGSPSQFDVPELEVPPQTADQAKLFPLPPRRHDSMMPLENWTRPIPLEPVEPPVGRLYENLHSDPRVFFAGAPSSYHTGIAAELLRPMRDRALVCPNREVRHVPEGVAMIRRSL